MISLCLRMANVLTMDVIIVDIIIVQPANQDIYSTSTNIVILIIAYLTSKENAPNASLSIYYLNNYVTKLSQTAKPNNPPYVPNAFPNTNCTRPIPPALKSHQIAQNSPPRPTPA